MKTILIIDDDIHIGNALEETLTGAGYNVKRAYSGTEAVLTVSKDKPDLVLLDLMLPGLNGEEVLPHIKDIPVIIMSAETDIDNKVNLLMSGAVDYVTKPFNTKELLARISIHLRTFSAGNSSDVISYEDLQLYTDRHEVRINDAEIRLTRTEYAILKLLMQNQAQIVSKSKILDTIFEDTPDCCNLTSKTKNFDKQNEKNIHFMLFSRCKFPFYVTKKPLTFIIVSKAFLIIQVFKIIF